jgi:hypothetical protein
MEWRAARKQYDTERGKSGSNKRKFTTSRAVGVPKELF